MSAINVISYLQGKLHRMDNASNHLECNVDVTEYPFLCTEHDQYLYDERITSEDGIPKDGNNWLDRPL